MAAELNRFDRMPVRAKAANWGAVAVAASPQGADVFDDGYRMAAFWGCVRMHDRQLAERADRLGVARALAEGYEAKGNELVQALSGAFALAILDRRRNRAMLAVDRMGARALSYAASRDRLVFGSRLDAIKAYPGVTAQLSEQSLYDYVYYHVVPGPRTIYTDLHRLEPGTVLTWENGSWSKAPYWRMHFLESDLRPFGALKGDFIDLLEKSVAQAVNGGRSGAFLSGGTDSSTVAGMMRKVTGEAPRTYSIGFDAPGFDEMSYARIAARHFQTQHHEYYLKADDVVSAVPRIAAVHDQPFGNASAVPTYYCALLAKNDGVDTLLAGDGGDELFGGNTRYAKQYLYSLYSDLPRPLRKLVIEPLAFALPERVRLAGKVQRYITNASQPMPARYDNYNLLERLGVANVFTGEFLSSVNPQQPPAMMAHTYAQARAQTLINRMLALDLKYTLADNDLPKVSASCELAGLDVRFPMLDDAVVAFAGRLPAHLKLKGPQLRYFFKQALRDFLPAEIISKKKHGFGLPFGLWLQAHRPLQAIVADNLGDLKRRRIIRAEFIDELSTQHLLSHPNYYGPMVWVLLMLESWFKRSSTGAAA